MKPTSPVSLLLFLSLTTAAPIISKLPTDCLRYTTCEPWLRELVSSALPSNNDHTPPTRLAPPHFPEHQLYLASSSAESHHQHEDKAFNNAPLAPPSDIKPNSALSANRPLRSSYLLSISSPALYKTPRGGLKVSLEADALPAKPTSALPKLREQDFARYWQTDKSENPTTIDRKEGWDIGSGDEKKCGGYGKFAGVAYYYSVGGQPIMMAREYSDLLVVGIVVLFVAAVAVMETVEYFGDLRAAISRRWRRRGEIFLEDDESPALHVRKSFSSQPQLISKYKTTLSPVLEAPLESEKVALYHD